MQPITIKLTEEQRFLLESQNDEAVMMVREINIFPENGQISFDGTYFLIDFAGSQMINKGKYTMTTEIIERDVYENEGEDASE